MDNAGRVWTMQVWVMQVDYSATDVCVDNAGRASRY